MLRLLCGYGTGVLTLSDTLEDRLKYQYVRRKTYDYHHDRQEKKFDGILHRLSILESFVHDLHEALDVQAAEIESLQLTVVPSKVALVGRHDALRRKD